MGRRGGREEVSCGGGGLLTKRALCTGYQCQHSYLPFTLLFGIFDENTREDTGIVLS